MGWTPAGGTDASTVVPEPPSTSESLGVLKDAEPRDAAGHLDTNWRLLAPPPPATWGHPLVAFGQTRKGRHAGPGGGGRDEGPNPTEPYRTSCAGPLVCPGARWTGKGTRRRGPRAGDVTRKLNLKGKSPEPREDRRKRSAPAIQSPVAHNAGRRCVLLSGEPRRALWCF